MKKYENRSACKSAFLDPRVDQRQRGFSLMEMIVVIGITILFLSMMLVFTRTGAKQIILFREQAKFIAEIERAKTNTLQRLQGAQRICGYGISFTGATSYVLFRALPDSANQCTNFSYAGSGEDVETFTFDPQIQVTRVNNLRDILFIPPEPRVAFDGLISAGGSAIIQLGIAGGNKVTITVNSGGQIVAQ